MTQLKRLLDDPGSDLDRVLLEAGMHDEPPKASLDRTLVALGVGSVTAIGAGALGVGAGASLGGAKASGLFGAGVVKWMAGALITTAAIGGGVFISQRAERAAAPIVAPRLVENAPPAEVTASELIAQRADPAPAGEVAEAVAATQSVRPASQGGAAPAEAAPAATAGAKAQTGAREPAPEKSKLAAGDAKPAKEQPEKPAKTEKPKADLTAGGGTLSDELKMLDVARRASLAGDSDACLASLASYGAKFPKGQMAAEAQAMKASCKAKKQATP